MSAQQPGHGVQGLSLRNQTDLNGNTACVACQFSHGLFNLAIFGFLSTLKVSPKRVSTWPQKHGLGWETGDVKRILNFIQVILLLTGDGTPPPPRRMLGLLTKAGYKMFSVCALSTGNA